MKNKYVIISILVISLLGYLYIASPRSIMVSFTNSEKLVNLPATDIGTYKCKIKLKGNLKNSTSIQMTMNSKRFNEAKIYKKG